MADMSDLLSGLLGDPENISKLARIASMLGATPSEDAEDTDYEPPEQTDAAGGDLSSIMLKAVPLISEYAASEHDPKVQLLYALRPYLTGDRRERLEDAVMFIKLSHVAGSAKDIFST